MCVTYEITADKKCSNVKFFVQTPFFDKQTYTGYPHSHIYSELHIVCGKSLTYNIKRENYVVNHGEIIVIPKDVSHHIVYNNDETLNIPFLVDYDFKDVFITNVNKSLVSDFALEIEKSKQSQNFNTIRTYLSFFFNYITAKHDHTLPITANDYKFLIHDFFSTRFNDDIKLSTLSKTLCLSERQTERLIVEYTGKNFREFLAYSRIKKAKELIEFSNMSMNEIASFVGYKSYSGFWKAMKKYSKERV